MVNQFKNNKFEKIFYELDKEIGLSDYQTVYYLPRLESALEFAFTNKNTVNIETLESVQSNLDLLKNEINIQLKKFGQDKYLLLDKLTINQLDSATFQDTQVFLNTLTRIHVNRNNAARREKDLLIKQLTASPKKADAYNKLKQDYTNDQITSLVFDNKEKTRILEHKGRLIQQIYPVFAAPEPVNYFDFRTLFYTPVKYFMGHYFETLYFNTLIMWCMTFLFILALYFDLLKKIVNMEWNFKFIKK
jgi:hypothetical protein